MIKVRRKRYLEDLLTILLWTAAAISAAAVLAVLGFLLYFSIPLFSTQGFFEVFSWEWSPLQGAFGILPMIVGSVLLSLLALGLAFPSAIGICCFAHGLAPRFLAKATIALVHFMTSIPTVVYAFVSAMILPLFLRDVFKYGSGFSLLAAGLTLSLLILPTIVLMIHAYWRGLTETTCLTCASMGLTKAQELFWVLLPMSRNGLVVAFVLGFGRAIGDTIIALLLAGNAAQTPSSVLDSVRALTAHIAMVVATDAHSKEYQSVFAAGLILFVLTGGLSLAINWLQSTSKEVADDAAHTR